MYRWQTRVLVLWLISMLGTLLTLEASAATVRLDARDGTSQVTLQVGDRLRVELPAAPAKGFRWKARLLDASHLEQVGKDLRPDSSRLDATGTQVFVWRALSGGFANILITYTRDGDDGAAGPAKQIAVSVEIAANEPGSEGPLKSASVMLAPVAIYSGMLPCGECLSLTIELSLYGVETEGKTGAALVPSVYVERRRYVGATGGDRTIANTGKVRVLHGTEADPYATVYVLTGSDGNTENLKVEGDRLTPLDPQMLPLQFPPGDKYGLRMTMDANGCATGTAGQNSP